MKDASDLSVPEYPEVLSSRREAVIEVCLEARDKGFLRGDYKELVDLTLLYLGYETDKFSHFARPGAIHKARWMAKICTASRWCCLLTR